MKATLVGVLCAYLGAFGCGQDGDRRAGDEPADGGSTQDAAPDSATVADSAVSTDSAVHDAGRDASLATDSGPSDAGPPPCGDQRVRCNGKCLTLGESEGNCTVFAQVESTDLRQISAITATDDGELFVGLTLSANLTTVAPTILRYAPTGGAPTTLSTMRLNLSGLFVADTLLYFTTTGETSTVRQRMTGSIGQLPRAGGTPEFLVRDLADGYLQKTVTHFYVGSTELDKGLRRYDLMGKNETLLYDQAIHDFEVVGSQIYFIDNSFGTKPIMKMPLAGGTPSAFGSGQCQRVYGADAQNLYVHCTSGPTRIALTDAKQSSIGPTPAGAEGGVLRGAHLYYSTRTFAADGKFLRMAIADGTVQDLATLERTFYPRGHVVTPSRAYLVMERVASTLPYFILKINL